MNQVMTDIVDSGLIYRECCTARTTCGLLVATEVYSSALLKGCGMNPRLALISLIRRADQAPMGACSTFRTVTVLVEIVFRLDMYTL